jgi:regulatory protein
MQATEPKTDLKSLLKKASNYCARREACQFDVFHKLCDDWGADYTTANQVLAELVSLNFINEERFAKAFVNDKLKFRSWGPRKLEHALKAKKISNYSIQKALGQIIKSDQNDIIQKLIDKKNEPIKRKSPHQKTKNRTLFN